MIERSHLKILQAIEQAGSLTAAAHALHLTQSALSHSIKKLEMQLGTPLWQKEGRLLRLTPAGQYLLREAKRLLPQLQRLEDTLQHYAMGDTGVLNIGMECHPCYKWLLTIVAAFLQQWPAVDIDVKPQFQFGGMTGLLNHDIDILVTPDPHAHQSLQFTPVFPYEQVLVLSTHHPLAHHPHIEPHHLQNCTLYTYPVDIARLDIYTDFLIPAHCTPRQHKTMETTEMMLQLVAAQRGVAALPLWLAQDFQCTLPIQWRRLGRTGIHKYIHLGVRCGDASIPFIAGFFHLAQGQTTKDEPQQPATPTTSPPLR